MLFKSPDDKKKHEDFILKIREEDKRRKKLHKELVRMHEAKSKERDELKEKQEKKKKEDTEKERK